MFTKPFHPMGEGGYSKLLIERYWKWAFYSLWTLNPACGVVARKAKPQTWNRSV